MIFGKLWNALRAQVNKLANFFWTADPIAQMQYEYDVAVAQLKEGREGLEQYRALVERVSRQVAGDKQHVSSLEAKVKAYLQTGDRETAAKFALELQKAKNEMAENENQLKMHEEAYNNNVAKIKHATKKLADVREKISKYDAELKMSRAEAEMAKLAQSFNFDVTTDFGDYTPTDFSNLERGPVRVRNALQFSLNIPAVKALAMVGESDVFQRAQDFGMDFQRRRPTAAARPEHALHRRLRSRLILFGRTHGPFRRIA